MQREGSVHFSIIVPVYNVERYLPDCVKSVAEQPGAPDWECILVDDGSTDTSGAMCDVFAEQIPGVVAVHQKNGGLADARNTGLRCAQGDWVLFLDSDDRMAPGLLDALRREVVSHPGYDWFVGRYLELFEATGEVREPGGLEFQPGPFTGDYAARTARLYDAAHWSVWKYCIRRSFLLESGVTFWPEVRWAEDWPFDLWLLKKCEVLYFTDLVFTVYRVARAGSLLTDAANLPRRFAGIAAAHRRLQALHDAGQVTDAEYGEMLHRAADVFWPQARTAAVRDKALRAACLPGIEACRPLFGHGREVRTRRDWRLFAWLLRHGGPRLTLWVGAIIKRGN